MSSSLQTFVLSAPETRSFDEASTLHVYPFFYRGKVWLSVLYTDSPCEIDPLYEISTLNHTGSTFQGKPYPREPIITNKLPYRIENVDSFSEIHIQVAAWCDRRVVLLNEVVNTGNRCEFS